MASSRWRKRRTSSVRYIAPVVCYLLLLGGCVGNQSYRRKDVYHPNELSPSVGKVESAQNDCSEIPPTQCVDADGKLAPQEFYLAYIEFDDMGEFWSIGNLTSTVQEHPGNGKSQLDNALAVVSKAKQEAKLRGTDLVVIAFVHGWHNNASRYDEKTKNLAGFKAVLQELSQRGSVANPAKKAVVVGVFLSWRGQVLAGDRIATYWNRRDAAMRVGGPSMTETLSLLMFETKGVQSSPNEADHCKQDRLDADAYFIAIGHSFGGRILEHAIGQPLMTVLLERKPQGETCVAHWNQDHPEDMIDQISFHPPADLIVFLNPANDSFETKSLIEAFKRSGLTLRRKDLQVPGPLMLSITSEGDWATGKVMPFAQTLSIPGKAFRKYDDNGCSEGQLGMRGQTYFYRRSDGNVKEMWSHKVEYLDTVHSESDCGYGWPQFWAVVGKQGRCFRIDTLDDTETDQKYSRCYQGPNAAHPWNNTPFYVMHVPSALIPSHTDIFQDGTVKLLMSVVDQYDAARSPAMMSAPSHSAANPPTK
jgi:hypothetical protein